MNAPAKIVNAEFPEAFSGLFTPHRYKVYYGGRGGAKSWAFARALLIVGAKKPIRVLCARELQNSIGESVHKLLADQISALGLEHEYIVEKTSIRSRIGAEFFFEGIRHNTDKIKSYEGIDICWVEEAHKVLKSSWDVLIPTIRKDGVDIWGKPSSSEIWISFNPELEEDETYQRFVVRPPENALVVKVSYRDNPWFPPILRAEMEDLKVRDYDAYLNVWEGHCRVVLDGAVYADELRDLALENRVTRVPYDPQFPVHTFWDLGRSDYTAVWFAQKVGFECRIVDYYQNNKKFIDHYLDMLQRKNYVFGVDWLPHDGKAKTLGTKMSIQEQMIAKGRRVRIVPRLSIVDGINAARTLFPICWFDQEKTKDGLHWLRHYQYDINKKTGLFSMEPKHDAASHAADAFRMMAIAFKLSGRDNATISETVLKNLKRATGISGHNEPYHVPLGPQGWMR